MSQFPPIPERLALPLGLAAIAAGVAVLIIALLVAVS